MGRNGASLDRRRFVAIHPRLDEMESHIFATTFFDLMVGAIL